MQSKLISEDRGTKIYVVVFENGEEFVSGLQSFCAENNIYSGCFTAIGAFSRAKLGYYNQTSNEYIITPIDHYVEVASLMGNISLLAGESKIHAHAALASSDATLTGGHLFEAQVGPTLEVIVEAFPGIMKKKIDPETGLVLLDCEGE